MPEMQTTSPITIRRLDVADAAVYRTLRLQALRDHPEAFGSSLEEEAAQPIESIAQRLANPDNYTLGAFQNEQLVGMGSLIPQMRTKQRHRANIAAMYVHPDARGQGIAGDILAALVQTARELGTLEEILLFVTVGNNRAREAYLRAGFTHAYIDRHYLKIGDRYYDTECMSLSLGK